MRWPWVGSWMRIGHQEVQGMIWRLEFFNPTCHSLKKTEGLKVELMIAHAHVIWWIICKNPQSMGFRELLGWWARGGAGRVVGCDGARDLHARSHTPYPFFPHTLPFLPTHSTLSFHTPYPVHLVCSDAQLYPLSKPVIVNWWKWVKCFSESCELLCKLIEPWGEQWSL